MKSTVLCAAITAAVCVMTVSLTSLADTVSGDDAKGAVAGWVRLGEALGDEIDAEPESVVTYQGQDGKGEFHVVNLKGGGYVITSGDTGITPILCYSKTGAFDADENSPIWALLTAGVAARAAALEGTGGRRLSASTASVQQQDAADKWARLMAAGKSGGKRLQAKMNSAPADLRVASFVQSKWGQSTATSGNGYTHKYYNNFTPFNWPCGCVATAQSQTMRYFAYPTTAVEAKTFTCKTNNVAVDLTMQGGTYDWAHMPYVPSSVTYDWANVIGIAKLTSDVGISLCMGYKSGGSGTVTLFVGDSLVNTFGYSNAVADYGSGDNSGDKFKKNVLPSLDAKLPVVLGVHGTPTGTETKDAGHSILTDGYGYYNGELYIHLNFGWSGSSDAWYTPALMNASGYDFDEITCSVFNIFTTNTQYSVIASGRVLDQDGAAISGATVTAKYGSTTYATATSDSRGVYALILPPNSSALTYTVNATKSGYTSAGALSVKASQTVGETVYKEGNAYLNTFGQSASNSNSYDNDITMEDANLPKAATPESTTDAEFGESASVTLTCSTAGASIYYTLDGTTPSESSTLYTGPIALTNTTTVKARAIASGYARSDVFTRTFVSAAAIDEFYFRHNFSNGTKVFTAGEGKGLTRDQVNSEDTTNAKAVAGPDGPGTARHPGTNWGGFEKPTVLHGAWSAAMSLCMDDTENGVLVSFGRLNTTDQKEVALLSSSAKSNLYFKVMTTDSSGTKSVENTFTVSTGIDLTEGFHSIVLTYTPASEILDGTGSFAIYCDGTFAGTYSTTTTKLLGKDVGGMQYCSLMSAGSVLADLGAVSSQTNDNVAYYDFRFFDRVLTASEVTKYATAYPPTAPAPAPPADLEGYLFRYDFSDGTKEFFGSAGQTSDPVTAGPIADYTVAAYGQDGAATAVHVNNNSYGSDTIGGSKNTGRSILAADWTLAMSVSPGNVNRGILFSLGRANENGTKAIFIASSSSSGKLYVGTARKKVSNGSYTGDDRELAHEWELTTSADLTKGYHTIVASHATGGTVTVYVDGELAGTVDTTLDCSAATCVFGNGIQFNQAHGAADFLVANGYSQSQVNPDVAFQDVRFFTSAFTAEDAAAYAALYPAVLPGFSNIDQYAYVQSYGVNGVDTGYKATDDTKFVADFEFTDVSYKSWLMGASESGLSQTYAIYLNGSKQLAWTTRGQHWVAKWPSSNITGASIKDVRLVESILSTGTARDKVTASVTWYNDRSKTMNSKLSNSGNSNSLTTKGPSTVTTHLFRGNGIMDNDGQACRAKIYSFEMDDNCTSGVPTAFFAPTTDGSGAAGFTNVVARTFHGECLLSPSTALTFTSGVGQAEDYRYRSGKFYSRIYACTADSGMGLVKFDGGESAGTNAQYTARGRTAKIVAVPAEGCEFDCWTGDTWAIASGYSTVNDTVEVQSDTAIQLKAVFRVKPTVNALLTVAADGADSVDWSEGDWRDLDNAEDTINSPVDNEIVKVVAHKSFTLALDTAVFPSNLIVQADDNCVVTLTKGSGSFVATEVIVKSGVLKQGTANVLGATPKVTIEDGGTFDFNAKNVSDATAFHIAGAGAGDWPWALTSTGGAPGNYVHDFVLTTNATVGSAASSQLKVGQASDPARGILTLNGHTLTVAGGMWLTFRRLKTPGTGTILYNGRGMAFYESNINTEEGNTTFILGDGITESVNVNSTTAIHALEWRGCNLTSSSAALTVKSSLTGYGTTAKLSFADGAVAVLEGDLTVTSAMTAAGALALARAAGVETNVTVAATGTLAASGAITVGAGVIFNIGVNRPAATLTVDDAATLALRKANDTEGNVVFKVTSRPKNIVVYDTDGATEIANPPVAYDSEAGTVTIRVATPRWTNSDGTGSFDSAANWTVMPDEGDNVILGLSSNTVITATNTYNLGEMTVQGMGTVTFAGSGSIGATMLNVASDVTVDTCGKLTVTGFAGEGNVILAPAVNAITLSAASTLAGDLTIKTDTNTAFNVNAATSVSKFYVNAATNAVVTMAVGSGGSFKATSEAIVQHGVLKQGSATALGTTPKITVQDGGTFDINAKTIRQETPIYIAGAGAGDWPWALASSSGAMASGNYLYDLYLTADATTGAGQLKLGRSNADSLIYLNGHTLTAKSWLTLRNIDTKVGTIDLQAGASLNSYNNLNSLPSKYSGTTLILREGQNINNNTDREIDVSYLDLRGGTIGYSSTARYFGVHTELRGYGTVKRLTMKEGAKFKPDGVHYLNVTEKLSGTITVNLSGIDFTSRTRPVPLLKVPVALKDTASSAITVAAPKGWKLNETADDSENVFFTLCKKGFLILVN